MRLTKKTQFGYENENCEITECSNKLGQLEDIEDELGIDLIVFFKLLKVRKCYDLNLNKYVELEGFEIGGKVLYTGVISKNSTYKFSNYGKTWALTKKELK